MSALRICVRLALAMVLATGVVVVARAPIVQALLHLYLAQLERIAPHFVVLGMGATRANADNYVFVDAAQARPILIEGRLKEVVPGESWTAATLSGYPLQTVIVFVAIVVAVPAGRALEWLLRGAGSIVILGIVLMLDVPLVLLATLESGLAAEYSSVHMDWLQLWSDFLSSGGRLGLAVFAAGCAVVLGRRFERLVG